VSHSVIVAAVLLERKFDVRKTEYVFLCMMEVPVRNKVRHWVTRDPIAVLLADYFVRLYNSCLLCVDLSKSDVQV
jgi:hypothetical protein